MAAGEAAAERAAAAEAHARQLQADLDVVRAAAAAAVAGGAQQFHQVLAPRQHVRATQTQIGMIRHSKSNTRAWTLDQQLQDQQ